MNKSLEVPNLTYSSSPIVTPSAVNTPVIVAPVAEVSNFLELLW